MFPGTGAPVSASPLGYAIGKPYKYSYGTKTSLNEVLPEGKASDAKAYSDVGFEFIGTVDFTPVWQKAGQLLVKLEVGFIVWSRVMKNL
jgi:hypothetical protein